MILSFTAALLAASPVFAAQLPERRDEWQPTSICMYMANGADWQGQAQNMCAVPSHCGMRHFHLFRQQTGC